MEGIFSRNEEREAILETVRRYVKDHVRPVAEKLDRGNGLEECFSWPIIEQADKYGIRTMPLAEKYGGIGADCLTTAMAIEELARGDQGVAVTLTQNFKLIHLLQKVATEEQKKRYFPKLTSDPRFLMAIATSEPDRTSDVFIVYDRPNVKYQTKAERVDGGWSLNGLKHFISNGPVASLYLIFAQTNSQESLHRGSTCFLVERGTPGFTIGRVHDKMGERLSMNAELLFDSCFVPDECVLGEVDSGRAMIGKHFTTRGAYPAAIAIGVAVEAYSRTLNWTKTRIQGGKPIIEHSAVAEDIAKMRMLIDAARSYIYRAAWAIDHAEEGWDPTMAILPKVFATHAAWEIVTKALQLHGGYGYMREMGIEKLVRDAAAFWHSDGADRTMLLRAAKILREQS